MTDTRIHAVYSGRSTNWTMVALSTALLVPFLAMAKGPDGTWFDAGLALPLLVAIATAAVNLLTATSVRTLCGPNGVTVHFGVFGWPRFRYPLDRIERAEAIDIPRSVWGWGIYWSPRRGLMLTLRTGPALRLRLTNGRRITVSTPQPAAAVDAIDQARGGSAG